MKIKILACLMALSIGESTEANAADRIIGGTDAVRGSWPWVVSLQDSYRADHYDGHFCGGSLIAPDWVITAAHCVNFRKRPADLRILAGVSDLKHDKGQIVEVKRILVHPNYDPQVFSSDIALLQLKKPVANPVVIPLFSRKSSLAGVTSTVIGWGNMRGANNGILYPYKLQEVQLPIVSNQECNEGFEQNYSDYKNPITKTMLCAGYLAGEKDSCQGDSGGPLMIPDDGKWLLAGLVSWGDRCAITYGVYTRVSLFTGFVKEKMAFDYFAAADANHDGKVNKKDKPAKQAEFRADIENYLNQCWLLSAACGDLNRDSRVDWLDLQEKGAAADAAYQSWLAEVWEPESAK
jgi:secreted trypsin-like serine protease